MRDVKSSSHEATWEKRVRVAKRGETSPCKGPGAEAKGMRELVGNEIREALRWGGGGWLISDMGRYVKA